MGISITTNNEDIINLYDEVEWTYIRPGLKRKDFKFNGIHYYNIIYYCQDCDSVRPQIFMVNDNVWKRSKLDGFICLDCFEKRIGRKVKREEFTDAPCNNFLRR